MCYLTAFLFLGLHNAYTRWIVWSAFIMVLTGETQVGGGKTCYIVYHKSQLEWCGFKPRPLCWGAGRRKNGTAVVSVRKQCSGTCMNINITTLVIEGSYFCLPTRPVSSAYLLTYQVFVVVTLWAGTFISGMFYSRPGRRVTWLKFPWFSFSP